MTADPGCLPVRGDLAHIKLAGRCFVPHYAVPMPHRIAAGAVLRATGRDDADAIRDLPEGETFNVLDIAGSWAWGQLGEDGQVGYVSLDRIAAMDAAAGAGVQG
ncbi:SH3 domain-containing protein [Novosphingobium sp. PhB165]|uniref:SH3 domain-containing protein n=1 Tax=Novosphingobium sp. PhB165 TaxID=2485105 RepID=UPI0032617BA5